MKPTSKKLSGQALKDANAQISKLKKLGLYKGKSGRGQPTKYALKQVKQFQDVIHGRVAVVKAPRDALEKFKGDTQIKIKSGKLLVPKNVLNGEIVRYNPKSKTIDVFGDSALGKRYRKSIGQSPANIKPSKKGKRLVFSLDIKRLHLQSDDYNQIKQYMSSAQNFDWARYITVTEVDA